MQHSSFNTPSLFLIAKDMKRMKVWASVNESDIGQVHYGQPVTFTVDAYPKKVFRGAVVRVRLNAPNTQNVVVYTVEVVTDNTAGELLPYMTANLKFEVQRRADALLVTSAALRYRPAKAPVGGSAPGPRDVAGENEQPGRGLVYVEDSGTLRAVPVEPGPNDGTMTEVTGGELSVGDVVVVGEARGVAHPSADNPFAPKVFGGKR